MKYHYWDFLNEYVEEAALCANSMDELFFADAGAALNKARIFLEVIIDEVLKAEGLEFESNPNLFDKINYLHAEGVTTDEIHKSINIIRKAGNEASHRAVYTDMLSAFLVHKEMYNVAKWYVELYTRYDKKLPIYRQPTISPMPSPSAKEEVVVEVEPESDLGESRSITKKEKQVKEDFEKVRESYLEREISRLKISSAEAVENAQTFESFKNYMHIKRPIQERLEEVLNFRKDQSDGNLILLCGSVGDGKSHLLAYMNKYHSEIMEQYIVYNDATESYSPSKTAMQTLEENLKNFSDQLWGSKDEKVIIAINLGVLHNFTQYQYERYTFNKLKEFIEESGIFKQEIVPSYQRGQMDIISFTDYQMYELESKSVQSTYLSQLLQKIVQPEADNPFYAAYLLDKENEVNHVLHQNYRFLRDPNVQERLIQLVIQGIVTKKMNVSSRDFLNFIADILMTSEYEREQDIKLLKYEATKYCLPNALFNQRGRSKILEVMASLHPINRRTSKLDSLLVWLNSFADIKDKVASIDSPEAQHWLKPLLQHDSNEKTDESLVHLYLSIMYLIDDEFIEDLEDPSYIEYLEYLYAFNVGNREGIRSFYKFLKKAIFNWKGTPQDKYIYLSHLETNIGIAQELNLTPHLESIKKREERVLSDFFVSIPILYRNKKTEEVVSFQVDYSLYKLLIKVSNGYRPNVRDLEEAIAFSEVVEQLMNYGNQYDELLINFIEERQSYKLELEEYDGEATFIFKRVD